MSQDRQSVLEKLRAELAFIEGGGYRNHARTQWRPQFIFEDSPTCLNRDPTRPRRPCSECVLAQFVPGELGTKRIPCRYIPVNESGQTIDSFYRVGTQEELEAAVVKWLKTTIRQLEQENSQAPEAMFSKCANPDCRMPFHYGRGRFFRFHKSHAIGEKAPNTHSVQHFWLCDHCCLEFTLEYQDGVGVLIKNRPDVSCEAERSRFISAA